MCPPLSHLSCTALSLSSFLDAWILSVVGDLLEKVQLKQQLLALALHPYQALPSSLPTMLASTICCVHCRSLYIQVHLSVSTFKLEE